MIRDGLLKIATAFDVSGLNYYFKNIPSCFPDPLAPTVIEMAGGRVIDKGSGYPIKARFDVLNTFATADATLVFTFAVVMAADAAMTSLLLTLVQSAPFNILSLPTAGQSYELALPPLPSVASQGRAYLGLGMVAVETAASSGHAFVELGGAVDAYFTLNTDSNVPLTAYASGWSV